MQNNKGLLSILNSITGDIYPLNTKESKDPGNTVLESV